MNAKVDAELLFDRLAGNGSSRAVPFQIADQSSTIAVAAAEEVPLGIKRGLWMSNKDSERFNGLHAVTKPHIPQAKAGGVLVGYAEISADSFDPSMARWSTEEHNYRGDVPGLMPICTNTAFW
jgi:hypothetical protein